MARPAWGLRPRTERGQMTGSEGVDVAEPKPSPTPDSARGLGKPPRAEGEETVSRVRRWGFACFSSFLLGSFKDGEKAV